jgi:hypothetical protein
MLNCGKPDGSIIKDQSEYQEIRKKIYARNDLRKMGVKNWKQRVQERKQWKEIIEQAKTHKKL